MTSVGKFAIGLVFGILLAWAVSLFLASEEPEAFVGVPTSASVTPTTAALPTPWIEPGEALVDAAVILPRGLDSQDGIVVFAYDVVGLSPALVAHDDAEHQGDVVVLPESWVLTTGAGATVESTSGLGDHSVRFELPSSDDVVDSIRLIGWRVATPFGDRVELAVESGAFGSLRSGDVVIETVLDQTNSTIVQIDFHHGGGDWESGGLPRPLNPGWRLAGREGGFQLIWDGSGAPDRIVLEDGGFEWRPISGTVLVLDQGSAQ